MHLNLSVIVFNNKVWGKYLYIRFNRKNELIDVVIDSTGQLPFFYAYLANGDIVFSCDIEILFKVLGQKPEYNWNYLCSYVIYGNSSAIQTPFKGIFELPPGCHLEIANNAGKTHVFWNPLNAYKKSSLEAEIENDAVNVLQKTLNPWIKTYKNICVSLSGGLDSSSLVYCLKDLITKDQNLSAINYFHSAIKSSNEVTYARRVCSETDIKLTEIDISHCLPFDPIQRKNFINPNKPYPGLISLKWFYEIADHLPNDGSCTFLSGHGSDHIFMRPPPRSSITDYLVEKGFKGLKAQLNSITNLYRDSLYSLLKENTINWTRYAFSQRESKRTITKNQNEIPIWFNKLLYENVSAEFVHPIYNNLPQKILPGKFSQIDSVYEGLASIHVEMNKIHPISYPFLYKPVVEFALSFPTYNLFDKGYDRFPLRESVNTHFNTETVWRRDKSETTGIFQLGIKQNLESVLNLCLEGQFVKEGLIDKESLHKTIMLIENGGVNHMWQFVHLASCEIFLNYWKEKTL